MSFQLIRAHIESRVYAAFQTLSPPVEVVFDNTLETPAKLALCVCIISYVDNTEPVICPDGGCGREPQGQPAAVDLCPPWSWHEVLLRRIQRQAMVCMNRMYD